MIRFIVIFVSAALMSQAQAQKPSGPANGRSCNQLVAECVAFNRARGAHIGRCARYKPSCIQAGNLIDRDRVAMDGKKR